MGYHRAGFSEIVGVDIVKRRNYPYEFVQGDALEFLAGHAGHFDAVHASPPCQAFVALANNNPNPSHFLSRDMLTPTLAALFSFHGPWVVENVLTAPMPCTVVLCGSSFGLKVRRHRKFASNFLIPSRPCRHKEQGRPVGVYGGGYKKESRVWLGGKRAETKAEASEAMGGLDWMTAKEICEAVPPSYTEYIGQYLLSYLQ